MLTWKSKTVLGGFAALLLMLAGAQEADAQRRGPRGAGMGPRAAAPNSVERAIRLAEELELTESQLDQLEGIRLELLEERAAATLRMLELSSEVRAGIREPEALRQEMRDLREGRRDRSDAVQAQVQDILSEDQLEELGEMSRDRRRGPRRGMRRRGR